MTGWEALPTMGNGRPYGTIWLAGFLFWLATLHWLRLPAGVMALGWLALAFYLSFYVPAFIGLARVAVHRLRIPVILAAPVVWTGLELARGHLLGGFTMGSLGHTQYHWLEVIQLADLAGAYGVGFVVMFVAACLARMVPLSSRHSPCAESLHETGDRNTAHDSPVASSAEVPPHGVCRRRDSARWAWWPLVPLVVVLAATWAYGRSRLAHDSPPAKMRVALVQGSVDTMLNPPQGTRQRIHEQYRRLSREAVERYGRVDLVVWPETVFGHPIVKFSKSQPMPKDWPGSRAQFDAAMARVEAEGPQALAQLARELDSPLLVGIDIYEQAPDVGKNYNSAVFVKRSGEIAGRYDKMHLIPFGEYLPFGDAMPWLRRLMASLVPSTTAGSTPQSFDLDGLRIAPSICYESVIPHLIRGQVNTLAGERREPGVLVNLTNDGWFWGSSELDMHMVCAVFRAVECRKPYLIAANTGFSAWIDADGRIVARGPRRATGTLLAEVSRDDRASWYLRHGDWFAGTCLVVCLACAVSAFCPRRRSPAP